MNPQPLTQFENSLVHQIRLLTEAMDRNTAAIANGPKPMLTDAEAAQRLGYPGEDADQFMIRMRGMGLFHSIKCGHRRMWSAEQIDAAFAKAHTDQIDLTPTAQSPKSERKPRQSAA